MIIPAHWELIRAKEAGREPDPAAGARGKQRSVHNNYLTLPVLFAMLSNHFAFTYTHAHAWLVLVCFMVIGAAIRHFFNLRHQGRNVWAIPVVCGACARRSRVLAPAGGDVTARPARRWRSRARRGSCAERCMPLPFAAPDAAGILVAARRSRVRHTGADQGARHRRSSSWRSS